MSGWLPWLILTPFAGAIATLLLPRAGAPFAGLLAGACTFAAAVGLLGEVMANGTVSAAMGGWAPPLGIEVRVDGLSMLHILLLAILGLFLSVYALGYFRSYTEGKKGRARDLYWPLWMTLWGGLNALFVSADLFNLYVVLELVGLSAVGLVVLTGTREVLGAGIRYMLTAMVGSMAYLLGVVLLYGAYGTLDLYALGETVTPSALSRAALVLMTVGLLVKTAVFPFHFWLPPAHASATAPVSALLSALVVKGSFYILLRLWFQVFPDVTTPMFGTLLGVLGGSAILWGSIQALRQQRLKMLIAHSTVAQLGYLLFIFPVTAASAPVGGELAPWVLEAGNGTLCHVVAHALAKASMFLSAGAILHAFGRDDLDAIRGLSDRMPLTVFSLAIAGVSIMGLPPSGGFIAKWLLMHAVLGADQWWWAPFLVLGGLLTAGYLFKLLGPAFLPAEALASPLAPVPRWLELVPLALALASIGMGIGATNLLDVATIGEPFLAGGGAP